MYQYDSQKPEAEETHFDRMMKEIESVDPDILFSLVPGSRLHTSINNPVTEGIDEGW